MNITLQVDSFQSKAKHNTYQSHWTALIIFYTITSVKDQDEPSQIFSYEYYTIFRNSYICVNWVQCLHGKQIYYIRTETIGNDCYVMRTGLINNSHRCLYCPFSVADFKIWRVKIA
jgi:hypothetical protein